MVRSVALTPSQRSRVIIVTAALREELAPLLSLLAAKKIYRYQNYRYYKSTVSGKNIIVVRSGMGCRNALQALGFLLRLGRPELVINLGFAGALSPSLDSCDVLRIIEAVVWPSCEAINLENDNLIYPWIHEIAHLRSAVSITVPRMLSKRKMSALSLVRNKTAVVDLESYYYAEVCKRADIPLIVLRGITDQLDYVLPFDLEEISDGNGNVKPGKALSKAIREPLLVPHFWNLWRVSSETAKHLAKYSVAVIESL